MILRDVYDHAKKQMKKAKNKSAELKENMERSRDKGEKLSLRINIALQDGKSIAYKEIVDLLSSQVDKEDDDEKETVTDKKGNVLSKGGNRDDELDPAKIETDEKLEKEEHVKEPVPEIPKKEEEEPEKEGRESSA